MKELDTEHGIGLIEKKRLGLGRPNVIYVKNFLVKEIGGTDEGDRFLFFVKKPIHLAYSQFSCLA